MTTGSVAAAGLCHPETTVTGGIWSHAPSFSNYSIPKDTGQLGDSAKGHPSFLLWDPRRPGQRRQPMASHPLSPSQNWDVPSGPHTRVCGVNLYVLDRHCAEAAHQQRELRHSYRCSVFFLIKTFPFSCIFASCEQDLRSLLWGSRALVTLEAGDASIFRCCRAGVP